MKLQRGEIKLNTFSIFHCFLCAVEIVQRERKFFLCLQLGSYLSGSKAKEAQKTFHLQHMQAYTCAKKTELEHVELHLTAH